MRHSINKAVQATILGTSVLGLPVLAQAEEKQVKQEAVEAKLSVGDMMDVSVLPDQWIQGEAFDKFEKDVVYVFDYWQAPWSGMRRYGFERKAPAYYGRKAAEGIKDQSKLRFVTLKMNDKSSVERVKRFLQLPELVCDHAIADDGVEGSVYQKWYLPMQFDSSRRYGFIVKNGQLVWSGETYQFQKEVLESILKDDFTLEKFQAEREQKKKDFGGYHEAQQQAYKEGFAAIKEGKSLEEAMKVADALEKKYGGEAFFDMSIQEVRYAIAMEAKDYDAARKALTDALDKHPKDSFVLRRVNKYVGGAEEIRPESDAIMIRSFELQTKIEDDKYAAACWSIIGDMKEKAGELDGAIEAYQKAVERQPANQRLIAIKKGETPPLATQ